ncbi:MAG: glycosyltransferase family 9 protein [Alphaproteobacteria bacterium]
MNILFITASRIGDAVLSTGLLDYIDRKHPNAKVTIVCGPLCTSLFEGYPKLARIIPLKKQKHHRHWLELWKQVKGTKWDIVVDLRNSVVSRLVPAKERFIFGRHIDTSKHKVEQNAAVMKLNEILTPKLWFTEAQKQQAEKLNPDGPPVLAIGPAANWRAKTWPSERFIEIIEYMNYPRVAVFAAPGEEEVAYKVLNAIPADKRIDMIARCDPGTAAAALARCDFYVGNDSGLMHCAAANQVKTLGLFGPSRPHIYRPWGPHANFAATPETFAELTDYPGYTPATASCLMESLTVETVKSKLTSLRA